MILRYFIFAAIFVLLQYLGKHRRLQSSIDKPVKLPPITILSAATRELCLDAAHQFGCFNPPSDLWARTERYPQAQSSKVMRANISQKPTIDRSVSKETAL